MKKGNEWDDKEFCIIEHRKSQYADIINKLYNDLSDKEKELYNDVSKGMVKSKEDDLLIKELVLMLSDVSLREYKNLMPVRECK